MKVIQAPGERTPEVGVNTNPDQVMLTGRLFRVDGAAWSAETQKLLIPFFVEIKKRSLEIVLRLDYVSVKALESILSFINDISKTRKIASISWEIDFEQEYLVQMSDLLKSELPQLVVKSIREGGSEQQDGSA